MIRAVSSLSPQRKALMNAHIGNEIKARNKIINQLAKKQRASGGICVLDPVVARIFYLYDWSDPRVALPVIYQL